MPLQVPAGTAPEPADNTSVDYLSSFESLPRQIAGHFNERTHPEIVSDRLASSARQFTVAIDRLGRQLDELKGAGVSDSGRDGLVEAVRALQGEFARGHTSAPKTLDAHRAIGGMHDRLTKGWDRMSDGQKGLIDRISQQLAEMEDIANRAAPRLGTSRTGRIARAVAAKHGLADHYDAVFAPKAARSGDDYQSSFARFARATAGRNGLGGVFDAAFKAHPGADVRRVGDAVAARRAAERERAASFIGPRAPQPASAPTVPSAPSGPAQVPGNVLAFIKPATRNTNVGSSTQAIPVISIGRDESRIAASMDGLNKNVIQLNDALDRDHRQRLNDYERRRQEQFDHDQALYGRKDSAVSHGLGGALAAAAAAHAKDGEHGGGWLTDLAHLALEGFGGEAAAAGGAGGLLLGGKKLLGRGAKGAAKGIGGLGRFMKGRHGRWGLATGLLAGTAYGAYRLFGADSVQAAENLQGGPTEDEPVPRRRRPEDGPETEAEAGEKPEFGFNAAETARGAAYHGAEKSLDAVAEHFAARREAMENARQLAARPSPEKAAAEFATRQRASMGKPPVPSGPPPAAPAASSSVVEAGSTAAKVEAPIAKVAGSAPGSGFGKEVERAASDVVKARTGARAVTTAARALGKGLLKVLGPLGVVLELYDGWQQLCDLYGARKAGEISEAEFNTEFYAILARMAAGPAGAAIGAELGAMGGAAAGAPFAGVGAGPGAVLGGLAGGVAGYLSGPKLADAAVHAVMDKAKPAIDAEIDARTKEKTVPSEPIKNEAGGAKPGGAKPGGDGAADALSRVEGTGPAAYNGQGVDPSPRPSSTGTGVAWDGATSHTIGGVGHQGEVRDAGNAFKGSGRRRDGRGVSAAEGVGTRDTGGTASSRGPVTPSGPMPRGDGKTDPGSIKGVLFKGESGGNPGIANYRGPDGRYHVKHFDSDTMTIGDLMKAQSRKEIFAAGKYQMIPNTLRDGVKALGLKSTDKFDSATQDRLYTDYLAGSKRPSISAYITGKKGASLDKANVAMAEEWASVGDPSRGGRGHYDGDGANHASISVAKAQAALQKGKATYDRLVGEGKSPEFARRAALLGIEHPEGDGDAMPTAPKSPAGAGTPPGLEHASGVTPAAPVTPSSPMGDGAPRAGGPGSVQPASAGPVDPKKQLDHLQDMKRRGMISDEQCVTLAMAGVGIQKGQGMGGNVHDWRKGLAASSGQLPVGTPVATFKDDQGRDSDRYAGGGIGTPGAHKDHAGVIAGYRYDKAGNVTAVGLTEQYQGSRRKYGESGVGVNYYPVGNRNARGPEEDGANYHAVLDRRGNPLGGSNNPSSPGYQAPGAAAAQQPAGGLPPSVSIPGKDPGASLQGAPPGPAAPRGADTPQVPAARPTDKVSTGWDPGMRSSYDAAATPQVPGAKADPGMRSAYDASPSPPADPGLRSAYDTPPSATKVDQPTDVPVQAAKTSAAITAASAPAAPDGDSSGSGDSSGGGSSGSGSGGSGGGYCRCTGGGSGGGGKMDGFGDSPMSPLLAMMNSTLFNRG